jgi:hypothetical protein
MASTFLQILVAVAIFASTYVKNNRASGVILCPVADSSNRQSKQVYQMIKNKLDPLAKSNIATVVSEDEELSNYDCSNKGLTMAQLSKIADPIHASTSLNLAYNNLGSVVYNGTFNYFKTLTYSFNLSSNSISQIDEHGFYFHPSLYDYVDGPWKPLNFRYLDLSFNKFERIPLHALKNLVSLELLWLNSNPIKRLDQANSLASLVHSSIYFERLKYINLSSCQIEFVSSDFFNLFESIEIIDLASNRIKFLSYQLGNYLSQLKHFHSLNVSNNPLECNCRLLWLKKFLIKYSNKQKQSSISYKQATCTINTTRPFEKPNDLIKIVDLTSKNAQFRVPSQASQQRMLEILSSSSRGQQSVSLVTLEDEQFICDIELTEKLDPVINYYDKIKKSLKTELKCVVRTYPKPYIWWTYGNSNRIVSKALMAKLTGLKEEFEFNEYIVDSTFSLPDENKYVDHSYTIESTLSIKDIKLHRNVSFACRTTYLFNSNQTSLSKSSLIGGNNGPDLSHSAQPNSAQKSILFLLNTVKYDYFDSDYEMLLSNINGQINSTSDWLVLDYARHEPRQRDPLFYWLIIAACIIFSLLVILIVGVCIVQNKRASKRKEQELMYAYSTSGGGSNNSSFNKRTYSTTSDKCSYNDSAAALQPLKPDTIREHRDQNPIYSNPNNRSLSRHSSPYSNAIYMSPNSVNLSNRMPNGRNATDSQPYYHSYNPSLKKNSNNRADNKGYPRNNRLHGINDPVESTLMDETDSHSLTASTKSFEENIEEYQDPKFDDLSKPIAKSPNKNLI